MKKKIMTMMALTVAILVTAGAAFGGIGGSGPTWFNCGPGHSVFALVSTGPGIGVAVFTERNLLTGAQRNIKSNLALCKKQCGGIAHTDPEWPWAVQSLNILMPTYAYIDEAWCGLS